MSSDVSRHQRIKEVFDQAVELPPDRQLEFLEEQCGGDRELLGEVSSLLAHSARSSAWARALIDQELVHTEPAASTAGYRMGNYRIIRLLGRGGMGEVYLARQESPVKRDVALKLIRLGMNTADVIARFERERQALALMDHPCIAKVFEAGTTSDGSPYFAMEYVPGLPILDYCDRHHLTTAERLALFQRVCEGVQHAHQKAVIHRDLKPGNILVREVDGAALPKIIDFGVAKAIAHRLTEHTVFTQLGVLIGTPEYMSPEQADLNQEDVDTRTDVYSLGVILYEMLVGALPFEPRELRQAGFAGIRQIIQQREPPKPSTKLSGLGAKASVVAANRRTEPRRLLAQVRGELDWILMKALEKERSRRYGSPQELAADISRYLRREPVLAGPPTASYRIKKFVGRHRAPVMASVAGLLMLASFAIVAGVQAVRIAQERDRAVANELVALGRARLETDPTGALAFALASLERKEIWGARELAADVLGRHTIRRWLPIQGSRNALSIDVSPDGQYCAIGWTREGKTTLTKLADMRTRELVAGGVMVRDVGFASDGTYLATAAMDSMVHLWRVEDGSRVGSCRLPGMCAIYSQADAHRLVVAALIAGMSPRWYELSLPTREVRELGTTRGIVDREGEWHGDVDRRGRWIADYRDNRILLQSIEGLEGGEPLELGRHESEIRALAFAPDGDWLASRDRSGLIRIWDLTGDDPALDREMRLEPAGEFTDAVLSCDRFRPRLLAAVGERMYVWDLRAPRTEQPLELIDRGHWVHAAAFLSDGTLLSCRNAYGVAHWANSPPRVRVYAMRECEHGTYEPSRDGDWIYCWCRNTLTAGPIGTAMKADMEVIPVVEDASWWPGAATGGQLREMLCSGFSNTGEVSVVDLASRCYRRYKMHQLQTAYARILPSGRQLVAIGVDSNEERGFRVRVCDLATGAVRSVEVDSPGTLRNAYAVAGDTLALLYEDHLALRSLSDRSETTIWRGTPCSPNDCDVGGFIAVLLDDTTLTLLDKRTGQSLEVGKVPDGHLFGVDYCEERGLVAVSGWRWPYVAVFSLSQGVEYHLRGHSTDLGAIRVFFDPQGRWLMTQSIEGWRKWLLPLDPSVEFLELEALKTHLRSLTNLRVSAGEEGSPAYLLSYEY